MTVIKIGHGNLYTKDYKLNIAQKMVTSWAKRYNTKVQAQNNRAKRAAKMKIKLESQLMIQRRYSI